MDEKVLTRDQASRMLMELRHIKRAVKRAERSIKKTYSKDAIFVFADKALIEEVSPIIFMWNNAQEI